MKISVHAAVSLILAFASYPMFKWKVLLILVGGLLIDIDHYFWYVYKYNEFDVFSCYNFFTVDAEKTKWKYLIGRLLIFHTIEFFLIIILFSFYNQLILIFAIGLLSHYLLDLIWLRFILKRFILNHSILYWIYKDKIQKV